MALARLTLVALNSRSFVSMCWRWPERWTTTAATMMMNQENTFVARACRRSGRFLVRRLSGGYGLRGSSRDRERPRHCLTGRTTTMAKMEDDDDKAEEVGEILANSLVLQARRAPALLIGGFSSTPATGRRRRRCRRLHLVCNRRPQDEAENFHITAVRRLSLPAL